MLHQNFAIFIQVTLLMLVCSFANEGPPKIKPFQFEPRIPVGKKTIVTCLVISGTPPFSFTWLKDGKDPSQTSGISIKDDKEYSVIFIDAIEFSSEGNYTCIVRNSFGTDRHTAHLLVEAPPVWEQEPENAVITMGSSLIMICKMTGSPLPTITWRKLPGKQEVLSTMGTLKISNSTERDSGDYECEGDNGVSPTLRKTVAVYIQETPTLKPFGFPAHVPEGGRTSAMCFAISGTQPFSFVWLKDGKPLRVTDEVTVKQDKDLSIIIIEPVHSDSSGNYTCKISNAFGSDNFSAKLEVKAPPKWIQEPTDAVVTLGSSLVMQCKASGSPHPRITWKKIFDGHSTLTRSEKEGQFSEFNSTLSISAVSEDYNGIYQCQADNGVPPALVKNITLTVNDLPKVKPFQFQSSVPVGDKAMAMCYASSSSWPIVFTWLFNGQKLVDSQSISITHHKDYSYIRLDPVEVTSGGNYTCSVSNEFGSNSQSTTLLVEAPPKWIEEPVDQVGTLGSQLVLRCTAVGSPRPNISWERMDAPTSSSGHSLSINNGTLTLYPVTENDNGVYRCTAGNGVEPTISKEVNIVVHGPPKVKSFSFEDRVPMGEKVSVTCLVSSSAPPTFTWFKDGKNAETLTDVRVKHDTEFSVLVIDPVTLSSEGNYSCVVSTLQGTDSYSAILQVAAPPKWSEEPVDAVETLGGHLTIRCGAIGSPQPKITWERVDASRSPADHRILANNGTLTFSPITEDDSGVYRCTADNNVQPSISKEINVLIYESPKITPFSFQDRVPIGKKVSVMCLVSSSLPSSFSWYKDDKNAESLTDIRIQHSNDFTVLIIDSVNLNNEGNYSCVATSASGTDSYSAVLRVAAAPSWKEEPMDTITTLGSALTIRCSATGSPAPKVIWKKMQKSSKSNKDHLQVTNGTLSFNAITEQDAGDYQCIADNEIEPSLSKTIAISIHRAPKIVPFSFQDRVPIGKKVSVTCLVASSLPSAFTWYKDSQNAESLHDIRIQHSSDFTVLIIDSVSLSNEGNYTCVAASTSGTDSFSAVLRVAAAPSWKEEPIDIITTLSSSLTIKCSAIGSPQPKVIWEKIDKSPEGIKDHLQVMNGTLSFNAITEQDAGDYQCIADNGVEPNLSKTIAISIHRTPKIKPFSFQDRVPIGEKVSVICLVASSLPSAFTWYKDSQNAESLHDIRIQHSSDFTVLIIDSVSLSNEGNYTCVAASTSGTDSFSAVLRVAAAPSWKEEPMDTITTLSSALTIRCSATGSPAPKVIWKKMRKSSESIKDHLQVTNGTLSFNAITEQDAGDYQCIADNEIEPSLSKTITISIHNIPKIKEFVFPSRVPVGDKTSAMCFASSSVLPLTFSWLKDGRQVVESNNITMKKDKEFSVIIINPVDVQSGGNYTCMVGNSHGTSSYSAILAVEAPPKWIIEPIDTVAVIGEDIRIRCEATGSPSPIVSWQKITKEVSVRSKIPLKTQNKTLQIHAITEEDIGEYECIADNGVVPSISKKINVIVNESPKVKPFSFQPQVPIGDKIVVNCLIVSSSVTVGFSWTKDGKEIVNSPEIRIKHDKDYSFMIIDPVQIESEGNYTCTASSAYGSDSYTATLHVAAPPSWKTEPNDIITHIDASVVINCEANGSPRPKIVWKKITNLSSSRIPPSNLVSNNGTLILSKITETDSGIYECFADNGVETGIRKNITISVRDLPEIQKFTFQDNVRVGSVVSAMCLAISPNKPLTFLWQKNGLEIKESSEGLRIKDDNEFSALIIDPVELQSEGNYTCIARNAFGSDKHTTHLNVKAPPKWQEEPKDVTATIGSVVTVTCRALGSPKPSITFRRLQDSSSASSTSAKILAKNDTLQITSVSSTDSGVYECLADNEIPPSIKANFTITIRDGPKIEPFSFTRRFKVGEKATATCMVVSSSESINFRWLKNGTPVEQSETIRLKHGSDYSLIIVNPIELNSEGNYSCLASNEIGTDTYSTQLQVDAPPSWKSEPTDIVTHMDASVIVNCEVNGSPRPSIVWRKIDSGSTHALSKEFVSNNGTLILSKIVETDSGVYECFAENGVGNGIRKNVTISVREVPKIQKFTFQDNVHVGAVVSVTCMAVSQSKPLTFHWQKDGQEMKATSSDVRIKDDNEYSILFIDPVQLESDGNYTCIARNNFGIDKHTAYLNVKAPPKWLEEPKDVTATIGSVVIITCRASGSPKPSITFRKLPDSLSVQVPLPNLVKNDSLHISSVSSNDSGMYECFADNEITPSIKTNFTITVREAPKIQKFNFQDNVHIGTVVSATCLAVSQSKPLTFHWQKNGKDIKESSTDVRIKDDNEYSIMIIDPVQLLSEGNYTCIARNAFGSDKHTAYLSVKAPPKWEEEPKDITATVGNTVIITCRASGSPKPSITFRKLSDSSSQVLDFKILTKNNSLMISSVSSNDTGMYECLADNEISPRIKANFSITVRDELRIEPFSFNRRFRVGEKATATCLVFSSSNAINFQWLKNGNSIIETEGVRVKHERDYSVIIVDPIELTSEGNYTCLSTNGKDTNTYSAQLQVEAPPVWIKEIHDTIVVIGSTFTLHCKAKGSPPPEIKLKKLLSHSSESSKDIGIFSPNGTFTLHGITNEDAGIYECEASNGVEPNAKKNFTLSVQDPPKLYPFAFPPKVLSGEKTTVTCLVVSASDDVSFHWRKNGHDIKHSSEVRVKNDTEFSVIVIDPVQITSSGNYTCLARNPFGTDSYTATLEVEGPPQWIEEPEDTTLTIDATLILRCRASGFPSPHLKWKKVQENISGTEREFPVSSTTKNSSLVITKVSPNDSGVYQCEADNGISPSIKKNVRVVVIGLPKIQPFSFKRSVHVGDKTTCLCSAESSSPLNFKWLKNGQEIETTSEVRVKNDAEFSVLIFEPVTLKNTGNYTCITSNTAGTDSFTAELIVEAPPTWIVEPINVTLSPGGIHNLRCSAEGSPIPQITWKKLKGYSNGNDKESTKRELVAKNGVLSLVAVSEGDHGVYECEADNGVPPVLKKTIFITVRGLPKIQPFQFPPNVQSGKTTKILCTVEEGTKPLQFKWKFNNADINPTHQTIAINTYDDYSILMIDPVSITNSGNYTCLVRNSAGEDSFTAVLAVQEPPYWTKEPSDVSALEGETISLHCEAIGHPNPVITWHRHTGTEEQVPIKDGAKYTIAQNGMLTVHLTRVDDSGKYECRAGNGLGIPLKKTVTLSVYVPARFEEKFAVEKARKGESARLKCEALGDQPLSVAWNREERRLSKNGDNRYEIFETLMPKGIVSELIIRTTDREDGALYSCISENEFGNDERKIRLLVMEVPAPPLDVKVRETWSRSASVSWASPYSGNSPITKYIVQYWRDVGGAPHRLHEISAPSSQSSVLIKELHPGTAYVLKVVAENAVGRGEPSDAVTFRTGEEEASSPPADIIAEPRGSSTIRVSWKPPPSDGWNGQLKGYYVGYKLRDSALPYSYKTVDYIPDTQQEFFLTNLLKASDYSVVVKAYNSAGSGPPSHELYVRTLDGDLPPAPSLYVLATSPTSISLRWNTRKVDNPLSGYTVHFREEQSQWQEVAVVAPDDNTYTLTNLHSGRLYQIYVTATNQYGKGDPSEIVAVKTGEGDGHSLLSVSSLGGHGGYMDMAVMVPVAASLLTICVVLIVACVCVRKIKSRQNLERALAAEKHLAMVGTMQRYVDIDKTRPLVIHDGNTPDHYPSPYETIPMPDEQENPYGKEALNQEMRSFFPKEGRERPTPFTKPGSLKKKDDHIYDSPQ